MTTPNPAPATAATDLGVHDPALTEAWQSLADDYAAGRLCGEGDRLAGRHPDMRDAPGRDPWWTAWCRGYLDGWIAAGFVAPTGATDPITGMSAESGGA